MERLIEGHKKFLAEVFPRRRDQFHLLAESQAPEWLFITCSDSRVLPDLILGTGPGDLFITRNAGNVVPVTANDVDGCTATIEYAVEVLKVKHAILCGHSDCGAMKAALDRTGIGETAEGEPLVASRGGGVLAPAAAESRRWASCGACIADSRQRGGAVVES